MIDNIFKSDESSFVGLSEKKRIYFGGNYSPINEFEFIRRKTGRVRNTRIRERFCSKINSDRLKRIIL